MRCKIVPYTLEDDSTPCEPFDKVMLFIGENPDEPVHCLDNIPKEEARILCKVINGIADENNADVRPTWARG